MRRQLLLLLIGFSLGPLFLAGLWGYWVSRAHWVEMVKRDVRRVARIEAARTLQAVNERRDLLSTIVAGNEHLLSTLAQLSAATDPASHERLRFLLRDHLIAKAEQARSIGTLTLISPSGEVIARSHRSADKLGRDERSFAPPLDSVRVLGLEASGNDRVLDIAAPVHRAGGELLAVLSGRFPFVTHESFVAAHSDLSPDSVLFLLDERKEVACGSESPHAQGGHPVSLHGRPAGLLNSDEGWVRRYELEDVGREVIAAYEPIPELDWGLLVEVPTSSVLAGIERFKWRAITFESVFALVLFISIYLVTRNISGGISRVARAALRIAGGTLGERIEVNGPAEIQDLARAFNRMSTALRDAHQTLEDSIVDRTRDLHESRELSELLLNSIEQRVIVVSLGGEIIKVNRTARMRYGEDLVGRRYSAVFPSHPEGAACVVARTTLSGVHQSAEYSESAPDGLEIVRWETYPVRGELGMTSVISIGRSITEEKRVQAQMLHQEKMASFGLLAAGMAHEIGNPLAAIESQLHLVRDAREPEGIHRTLHVVESEVRRMGRLLRDLVDFSRRRRNRVVLVSINQVIQDVARLLGHDPRSRSVQIELDLGEALPGIRGREDGFIQVLLNLGLNALDAMPEGGSLRFVSRHEDGEVLVRVCDSGFGIPPELERRVFEPFFTTKDPRRGTGLGLFVSQAAASDFGGRLVLEQSDTNGTTFALRIVIGGASLQEMQP